jgi:hypothetical protein
MMVEGSLGCAVGNNAINCTRFLLGYVDCLQGNLFQGYVIKAAGDSRVSILLSIHMHSFAMLTSHWWRSLSPAPCLWKSGDAQSQRT